MTEKSTFTQDTAEIIVDALIGAGLIKASAFDRAVEITEEELRVQLIMEDLNK